MNLFKSKGGSDVLDDEELYAPVEPEDRAPRSGGSFLPPGAEEEPPPLDDDEADDDRKKRKGRKQRSKRYGHASENVEEQAEEPEDAEWASPVKPSVSLPSRSVIERSLRKSAVRRMRKVVVIVGTGLAAAGLTCVGLNLYSLGQLNAEKARGEALQKQVDDRQTTADYYDGYAARRSAVADVLKADIQYSIVQSGILAAAKKTGVSVTSETVAPGQPCANLDPFLRSDGLGCITAQITSGGSSSVAAFADALNATPGLSGAYLNGVTTSGAVTTATANVNYTGQTVSERSKKFGSAGAPAPATSSAPTTTGGK